MRKCERVHADGIEQHLVKSHWSCKGPSAPKSRELRLQSSPLAKNSQFFQGPKVRDFSAIENRYERVSAVVIGENDPHRGNHLLYLTCSEKPSANGDV